MDITLCKTESCPSAPLCYRFMAIRDGSQQSEFPSDPRRDDGYCGHFLPMLTAAGTPQARYRPVIERPEAGAA